MTAARENAAQLDRAIDALLQGLPSRRAAGATDLVATAHLLRDALPRLHPRFSFEESLASRLTAAARGHEGHAPGRPTTLPADPGRSDAGLLADGAPGAPDRWRRNLVAGGAIASGVSLALPLAGAALVMWRRSRSSGGLL